MQQFQGVIGLAAVLLLAWSFSEDRANRPGWRWLGGALLLQLAIAVIVVRVPPIWAATGIMPHQKVTCADVASSSPHSASGTVTMPTLGSMVQKG